MIYSLRMTSRARFELLALADTLDRRAKFEVSRIWMKGIIKSIRSLENLPHRCTLAPETKVRISVFSCACCSTAGETTHTASIS